MTVESCPRCHGGKYIPGRGFVDPKTPQLTLRVDNVMGSTQRIHKKCSNCGWSEKVPYDKDGEYPEKSEERMKLMEQIGKEQTEKTTRESPVVVVKGRQMTFDQRKLPL
jgi:hypothetical protein